MKTKNYFKVTLFSMEWDIAKDVAALSCYVNSGNESINIEGLGFYARTKIAPFSKGTFTVNVIGNTLTIDKGTECLLMVEEREEVELKVPDEESALKELLDQHHDEVDAPPSPEPPHEAPTLHRYD